MAQQIINVGTTPNDGTGDSPRTRCIKINEMFTELYGKFSSGAGNRFLATPDGASGEASFRAIVTNDLPDNIPASKISNLDSVLASQVSTILQAVYPVGSIYISHVSTDPNVLFGFGTWIRHANGRVLVGVDETDGTFASVGATGGEKRHTLSVSEMPSHSHSWSTSVAFGNESETPSILAAGQAGTQFGTFAATTTANGSSASHNNLQPYITAYIWRRTA
jgi:hypothetical protein